jgi:hypothetical protein
MEPFRHQKLMHPITPPTAEVSGFVEEGLQTESIIKAMGFRPGANHSGKCDCERKNITLISFDVQ